MNPHVDRRTFVRSIPQYLIGGVRSLMSGDASLLGESQVPERRVAWLEHSRCLAWEGGDCRLCYTQCPLRERAIVLTDGRPAIVPSACDGCGVCVEACRSVNDLGAIHLRRPQVSLTT